MVANVSDWPTHFRLLNSCTEIHETLQERTTQCPLPSIAVWGVYKVYQFLTCRRNKQLQLIASKSYRQDKNITVIVTGKQWECFYQTIRNQNLKVIGIDCEWVKWSPKVSLLQIATQSGSCALVRLFCIDFIPDSLKSLMADKSILKVGVASIEDGRRLSRDYGFIVRGCVDLRHVLNRVRGIFHCEQGGLQGLASCILGIHLEKDPRLRMGNWEAKSLSKEQIEYAALDAIVGVDIFMTLILAKMTGHKPEISEAQMAEYMTNEQFWAAANSLCQGIVDIQYKSSGSKSTSKPPSLAPVVNKSTNASWKPTLSSKEQFLKDTGTNEEKLMKQSRAYVVRKRPLYYNCYLVAPDGQMLCTCDIRKVEWYISKGLADKVSDDPLTVKLRFEPAGRPEAEDDYYLHEKENVCVVCGSDDKLIRKQIIPKEYRRFFPTSLKDHASHDVLLMCIQCHQVSTQYDSVLRFQLADECSAPIDMGSSCRAQTDHDLMKIRSAGRALLNSKVNIPEARKEDLRKVILEFYGVSDVTQELLEEASEIDTKMVNGEYLPHGKKVIRHIRKNGGIFNFEKRWRQHFLDTMKPKYLPPKWSVDHRHERTHLYS
ncbi:hypothetical protein FSP39_017541 [Pinctada imbricata]|uniref:3'-5' exonuclease domain-containing protein n=1 Tax=Pinctada imbricata TaxID=66713 RepID=A0AA88Y6W8_PINIB|nr:hypothetical protein FSP39_017541 [Pinctada imbricata]